ncbi:MAG TPA: TetR/AcrR family transcriptional regulator [Myxococcaceae bacterium]|nr:TetR/AcrR family transcriptional regulator [Myxococcaceae bacterium]
MPRVSRAHVASRRRQILDAAWACFARKGFHATTMPEICRQAGLSTGAVYSYFRSKERIIEEGAREALASTLESMGEPPPGVPAVEALQALLERFLLALGEAGMRDRIRADVALWGEAVSHPRVSGVLAGNVRDLRSRLVRLVRRAQTEGGLSPALEPGAVSRVILALYLGAALQSLVDPGLSPREYAQAVRTFCFAPTPRARRG